MGNLNASTESDLYSKKQSDRRTVILHGHKFLARILYIFLGMTHHHHSASFECAVRIRKINIYKNEPLIRNEMCLSGTLCCVDSRICWRNCYVLFCWFYFIVTYICIFFKCCCCRLRYFWYFDYFSFLLIFLFLCRGAAKSVVCTHIFCTVLIYTRNTRKYFTPKRK